MSGGDDGAPITRRDALLGSAALGTASLSGCVQRVRSVLDRDRPEQVQLEIVTLPGDEDPVATQIARRLDQHLTATGVETELTLLAEDELRREVLINQEYDLVVTTHPGANDPDFLRPLLHSSFSNEAGWQNPFDFTDLDLDELVVKQQRQTGASRHRTVVQLQHEIARQQPFTVVAAPDEIGAVQTGRFSGWERFPAESPLAFVTVGRTDDGADRLRVTATDDRMTRNLNPIAIEFRNRGVITELLYDPLGHWYDGDVRPWAAEDWTFDAGAGGTSATVTLRPGLTWHDGSAVTSDDVAFTVRFLKDTSLGEFEPSAPAPRFRGQISLVEDVEAIDERRVRLTFGETTPAVAKRAFTVPILPRSEWEDKSRSAEIAGVSASNTVTEALVWENPEPVGSGVFAFDSLATGEQLVLSRNTEHFLHRESPAGIPARFVGGPPCEELSLRVVRSDGTAVELLDAGEVDAVVSRLDPSVVPRIGRSPEVELRVDSSRMFYLIGYNTTRKPLSNPHFRRVVARLLDKEHVVDEVLDGYATPAASPLVDTEWLASGLSWDGSDPELPFFGTDGELAADAARDRLQDAGFEFTDTDALLQQ